MKAFLCKVTRNHALYIKYPDRDDCEKNLLTAEFMVQEFVMNLNLQERKVFVARYWFFASVSEISIQHKMTEQKVEETLHSLYEKLNYELGQKCGEPLTEVQLLYAMTEIDDIYLEEAEPMKQIDVENCEETKAALPFNLNKKTILVIACGILLVVFLLVGAILISKFSNGQPPRQK